MNWRRFELVLILAGLLAASLGMHYLGNWLAKHGYNEGAPNFE